MASSINAFNTDFTKALVRLLGPDRVVCVVLEAPEAEKSGAADAEFAVLEVGASAKHSYFEETRADDVMRRLKEAGFTLGPATWWIGVTGRHLNPAMNSWSGRGPEIDCQHL